MGLSAPLALAGALLVALPIAAHLLRRADVVRRTLPTVALLRRAVAESEARVRVVDPWLLLLRVALVALGALALAGPYVERELAFGDGHVTSLAIVIDDSMSMQVSEGPASAFDAARARALAIVDALPEGSEVAIVWGGRPARVALVRTAAVASVTPALRSASAPGARGTDLAGALALASRQLAGARNARRRIVVLSDLRGPSVDDALEAPPGLRVDVERIGDDAPRWNVAVTAAEASPHEGGSTVSVELRAFGEGAPTRVPVRLERDGVSVAEASVSLSRGVGRTALEVPMTDGVLTAHATPGPNDPLGADDARSILVRPASAPRVVIVEGRPRTLGRRTLGGGGEASRYVVQALALATHDLGGPFSTRVIDRDVLATLPVGAADVLVLANVDLRAPRVAEAIRAHVADGAGLLVTSGSETRPGGDATLAEVLPARVIAVEDGAFEGLARTEGAGWLAPGPSGLEAVRATRRLRLAPSEDARAELTWPDGTPAALTDTARRSAWLAVGLDDAWSDLPFRPGYVPLIVGAMRALTRPGAMPDAPLEPGGVPALASSDAIELTHPDGRVESRDADHGRVALDDVALPGAYTVRARSPGGDWTALSRGAFVVAPPTEESDLVAHAEASVDGGEDGAQPEEEPRRARTSLASWLFLALGAAAGFEGLARVVRVPRSARRSG